MSQSIEPVYIELLDRNRLLPLAESVLERFTAFHSETMRKRLREQELSLKTTQEHLAPSAELEHVQGHSDLEPSVVSDDVEPISTDTSLRDQDEVSVDSTSDEVVEQAEGSMHDVEQGASPAADETADESGGDAMVAEPTGTESAAEEFDQHSSDRSEEERASSLEQE